LQVLLGSRFEDAGGQAPTIVSDPIDLDGSCHGFPALVLAFYALLAAKDDRKVPLSANEQLCVAAELESVQLVHKAIEGVTALAKNVFRYPARRRTPE
jgi:hypothetical protein